MPKNAFYVLQKAVTAFCTYENVMDFPRKKAVTTSPRKKAVTSELVLSFSLLGSILIYQVVFYLCIHIQVAKFQ